MVYVPAERADTLSLFLLYPYMYSVVGAASNGGLCTIYSTLYRLYQLDGGVWEQAGRRVVECLLNTVLCAGRQVEGG